jgi:hypothetical protein
MVVPKPEKRRLAPDENVSLHNRRVAALICILMGLVIQITACTPAAAGEIRVAPGQEIALSPDQTAVIIGENLSLKFKAVSSDSRCPKGVACIWAGEAKCLMQVTLNGAVSEVVFTENGGADAYSRNVIGAYTASYRLTPYPEAGKPIAAGDYRLLLKVLKAGPV